MSAFKCPFCGTESRHPDDVQERYCSVCDVFVDDVRTASDAVGRGDLPAGDLERLAAGTGFSVDGIQRALRESRE